MSTAPTLSPATSPTLSPATAYRAEAVARAERALTASTDRYMHLAAHALALAAVRELRGDAGRVAGCDVLLLVGGGHNGGDALLAGALLARRGCAVTAALAGVPGCARPGSLWRRASAPPQAGSLLSWTD